MIFFFRMNEGDKFKSDRIRFRIFSYFCLKPSHLFSQIQDETEKAHDTIRRKKNVKKAPENRIFTCFLFRCFFYPLNTNAIFVCATLRFANSELLRRFFLRLFFILLPRSKKRFILSAQIYFQDARA